MYIRYVTKTPDFPTLYLRLRPLKLLKMTDYESFCNALKISWIKRWNDENNNGFWKQNLLIELDRFGGNYIWYSNFDTRWIKNQHISSHFLRDVLVYWQKYSYESPASALACGNQGLWHNS